MPIQALVKAEEERLAEEAAEAARKAGEEAAEASTPVAGAAAQSKAIRGTCASETVLGIAAVSVLKLREERWEKGPRRPWSVRFAEVKKGGRPPKAKAEQADEADQANQAKAKRGRPAKAKAQEAEQANDAEQAYWQYISRRLDPFLITDGVSPKPNVCT